MFYLSSGRCYATQPYSRERVFAIQPRIADATLGEGLRLKNQGMERETRFELATLSLEG